jgi:hypothetical protein
VISYEQSQSLPLRNRLSPNSVVRKTTRDRLALIYSRLFLFSATLLFLPRTSLDFELYVQIMDNKRKEAQPHIPKEHEQNGENIPALLGILNDRRCGDDPQSFIHHFL